MSVKKNSSLRNALREMRVSEPQRLPKSGPSFKPPVETPAVITTEVPLREVPPSEVPRSEAPQNVETQKESPRNEVPQLEGPQVGVPRNEVPLYEEARNKPPQEEQPYREVAQIEPPRNEAPSNELARNESSQNEVRRDEAPLSEVPQNEQGNAEETQSKTSQNEVPHNQQPQIESPQVEKAQPKLVQNEAPQAQVARTEQAKLEAPRKKQAKNEVPQNEATASAGTAQIELPQIEQPSKAFFRLSERAFSYPQLQRLSGDCFRLFLWMSSRGWRFQHSDGTVRASVGFIEDHTAMSHATISRCLKTLKEEALVELLETDYKRGNLWSISPIAFAGCDPENLPPRSEGPQNEGPRKEAVATSKRDRSHLNLREKPPQNEGQIRSIKNSKNLSQEGAETLFARIQKIRAPEKQKSEGEGLMLLLEKIEPLEIETALAYVEKYGTLSGESCHSPFKYLSVAIDDVLQACRKKGFTLPTKTIAIVTETKEQQRLGEQQSAERLRTAMAAFENEMGAEERTKFVDDYIAKAFAWGYKPSGDLATRLAVMEWFDERQTVQQAAV